MVTLPPPPQKKGMVHINESFNFQFAINELSELSDPSKY